MHIRAAVFDLDGTLLDTLDDLTDSVNYALARSGFPLRTREEVRQFVGNGVRRLAERAVPPGTGDETLSGFLACFRAHYAENMTNKTAPYPGVCEALAELKKAGIRTAIVSNKFDGAVKGLWRRYFPDTVDDALGERDGTPKKPDPALLLEALERLRVLPGEAVYIGDSDVDVETARNAGVPCIAAAWGFRSEESLRAARPLAIANAPMDWIDLLKGMNA